MTTTIHPWTMYEVARFRDEERLLRSQAGMRALKPWAEPVPQAQARAPKRERSLAHGLRRIHPVQWVRSQSLFPHHARHV